MNRIKAINSLIEKCQCVYDVGSDHALLAVSLLKDKKVVKMVNIEIASGPLKMGLANLAKNHLTTKTLNVENDGLKLISRKVFDQPNYICIAGMGGNTIIDILTNKDEKISKDVKYILEANTEADLLRKWLGKNKWEIIKELTISDRGKYYQIIVTKPGIEAKAYGPFDATFGTISKQVDKECWINYLKFMQKKIVSKKLDKFNPSFKSLLKQINSKLDK